MRQVQKNWFQYHEFPFGNLSHLVLQDKSLLCFSWPFHYGANFPGHSREAMRIPGRMGVDRLIKALRL